MKWTKEIPQKEGWYWWRASAEHTPEVFLVIADSSGNLIVEYRDGKWERVRVFENGFHPGNYPGKQWAGPIPEPE